MVLELVRRGKEIVGCESFWGLRSKNSASTPVAHSAMTQCGHFEDSYRDCDTPENERLIKKIHPKVFQRHGLRKNPDNWYKLCGWSYVRIGKTSIL